MFRVAAVAVIGGLVAFVAVRNAAVQAFAEDAPDRAAALWPGHPDVLIAQAQQGIAVAAGRRGDIPAAVFASVDDAARRAPLDPYPYVVAGIRAQTAGRADVAERAFVTARDRDPRFLPARYFLAGERLQRGDARALDEVAALARLSPDGAGRIAPYLAAFAKQRAAWAPLKAMLDKNPAVRETLLSSLAQDPANLEAILALGGTGDPAKAPWLGRMIETLVAKQRYGEARVLWARTSRVDPKTLPLLFDGAFNNATAPAPFNWQLTSSDVGLAERRSGRLQVIFYGQTEGVLARQLLLLGPGRYRLDAPASASQPGDAIRWQVRCAERPAMPELAVAPARAGGLTFAVPGDCPAQWLELIGKAADFGRQNQITVGPARLGTVGS